MIASLKLGLICVSSCSMARTTGYEYKRKSGLESRDPGIGERSGFQSRDSKSFGIDTTSTMISFKWNYVDSLLRQLLVSQVIRG